MIFVRRVSKKTRGAREREREGGKWGRGGERAEHGGKR